MEIVLNWNEQVWTGNVVADGASGVYNVHVPISVEKISSRDLGCSGGTGPSQGSNPQPVLTTAEVDAGKGWQSTGVTVEPGTKLNIRVTGGKWTNWKGNTPYNTGEGTDYVCASIISAKDCVEPVPDYPAGALVGRIGNQILRVGKGATIPVTQSGVLFLRINDGG